MPSQQQAPIKSGFPPVFTNVIISLLSPTAAIAITIRNLLSVFNGVKTAALMPNLSAIVVISDAAMKYKIKKGNIFLIFT